MWPKSAAAASAQMRTLSHGWRAVRQWRARTLRHLPSGPCSSIASKMMRSSAKSSRAVWPGIHHRLLGARCRVSADGRCSWPCCLHGSRLGWNRIYGARRIRNGRGGHRARYGRGRLVLSGVPSARRWETEGASDPYSAPTTVPPPTTTSPRYATTAWPGAMAYSGSSNAIRMHPVSASPAKLRRHARLAWW